MTNTFDEKLFEIPFFKLYNEYIPFIGDSYDKYKVLIIGESHYIGQTIDTEKYSIAYFNQNWWNGNCAELQKEYSNWFNTRVVINGYLNGERHRGHLIFTNLLKTFSKVVLNEPFSNITIDHSKKFNYFAFMNFFQMPSLYKGMKFWNSLLKSSNKSGNAELSHKVWQDAVKQSSEVLDSVIDIFYNQIL